MEMYFFTVSHGLKSLKATGTDNSVVQERASL